MCIQDFDLLAGTIAVFACHFYERKKIVKKELKG